jgi:hypothetical protein
MHKVEVRAAEAGATQRARDDTGGQPVELGVRVRLLGHGRWQLGQLGLHTGEEGASQIWAIARVFAGFRPMAT